jgi:hypothetical protein
MYSRFDLMRFDAVATHRADNLNVAGRIDDDERTIFVGYVRFYEKGRFVTGEGFFAEF